MTRPKGKLLQVFLVDDHVAVRHGVQALLQVYGMRICGQAGSRGEAEACLETLTCDVAVIDLTLGDTSGTALIQKLTALRPGVPVLVYSMHEERRQVEEALAAGARGYVTKRDDAERLAEGVAKVAAGGTYLSPRVVSVVAEEFLATARTGTAASSLSVQERRVYSLLGEGLTVAEIAGELSVSPRTVQSYCSRIMTKLGLCHMRDLRRRALSARWG